MSDWYLYKSPAGEVVRAKPKPNGGWLILDSADELDDLTEFEFDEYKPHDPFAGLSVVAPTESSNTPLTPYETAVTDPSPPSALGVANVRSNSEPMGSFVQ